jgi:putative cardiolipin synthase
MRPAAQAVAFPRRARRGLVAGALPLLLAGCISLPTEHHPPPTPIPPTYESGLGLELAPYLEEHPGKSGFALLQHGPAALLARAVLADLAASTIDVQYYIYEDDLTGILLTQKLLDAADRGVRVRILLDDNNLRGSDAGLKLLASHPSIEIRVFNPYRVRARWMRPLELMVNFGRLQRRMHNKIFAVDGVTGIFGGRNIGNNYFDAHDESNFADFDVFVAGPLIGEATASFESYWTHPLAVPAEQLTAAEVGTTGLEEGRRELRRRLEKIEDLDERYDRARSSLTEIVEDPEAILTWARAEFVVDPPGKLDPEHDGSSPVLDRLVSLWAEAEREVLIESAYFVPLKQGAQFIVEQAGQGVRTRVLTNSLAANDVPPVHAGYAKYRRRLLKAGVELYEFQRLAARGEEDLRLGGSSGDASLHAKVAVFDRRVTWVGSFNLDPRSAELNTELAIVIHSEDLGGRAAALIERDLEPDRAWRLALEPRGTGGLEMVWYGRRGSGVVRETSEPDATMAQRAIVNVMKFIPGVEGLL